MRCVPYNLALVVCVLLRHRFVVCLSFVAQRQRGQFYEDTKTEAFGAVFKRAKRVCVGASLEFHPFLGLRFVSIRH